ncbi:MAG: fumarylacetoacetate hydrolase family protein [Prevotella sp.]|jgi:2-keto-4-pentenoate hydratase/2-oxohepta-3-ene-1,7-dioic acid hydratase in catechol pathway
MKIFGVGMNYLLHTEELHGHQYRPEEPVIFLKADSALLKNGKPFFIPDWSDRVDYEAELVVRICRLGKSIPVRFAHRYYDAATVGIDFTARDIQQRAQRDGLPWTICKGFDGSAAIGSFVPVVSPSSMLDARFRLDLNGKTVQQGCSADMVYSIDELISYISRFFTLRTGDLLFTGTPVGVGPVSIGDHLEGYLGEERVLDFYCR